MFSLPHRRAKPKQAGMKETPKQSDEQTRFVQLSFTLREYTVCLSVQHIENEWRLGKQLEGGLIIHDPPIVTHVSEAAERLATATQILNRALRFIVRYAVSEAEQLPMFDRTLIPISDVQENMLVDIL